MPRIVDLPGGEATSISDTDNLVVEPSGGQTKFVPFSVLLEEVNAEKQKACKVVASSEPPLQAIDASAWTALAFTSEVFDYGGLHSVVSNDSRITIPSGEDGVWMFGGMVTFEADSVGVRGLKLQLNGSVDLALVVLPPVSASIVMPLYISTPYIVSATDYMELLAYHTSTTDPLDIASDGLGQTQFWAFKIAEVAP